MIRSSYYPAVFVLEWENAKSYATDFALYLCPCGHFCELPVRVSRAHMFACCECARMSHHDCRVCQKPARAV